jgi:putative transcriptional regulator
MQKPRKQNSSAAARRVLKGTQQILDYLQGDVSKARVHFVEIVDVKATRAKLKLSQEQFAETYGIPLRTVQSWEQGVLQPDATARAYLKTIGKIPAQVRNALAR